MNKMLSKVFYLAAMIAVLILAGALAACSAPTPSDVVKAEFDSFINEDVAQLAVDIDADEMGVAFPDSFLKKMQEFNYTLGEETITEDTATVAVTITTYDFGVVYPVAQETYFREDFSKIDYELSGEELTQGLFDAFFEAADDADFSYTETVTVPLSKVEGKWMMDDLDENNPLTNALWGGLLTTAILSPADSVKMSLDVFIYQNASRFAKNASAGGIIVYPEDYLKMLQKLEYTLGAETIEGDHASVDLTIHTYDFHSLYLTSAETYLKGYVSRLKAGDKTASDLSDAELTREMYDVFFAAAPDAEFSYTETVTVFLSKADGAWVEDDPDTNKAFVNALWGGLQTAPDEMDEKMQDSAYVDSLMF
jgi:hypothetical protein